MGIYTNYDSVDELPVEAVHFLEKQIFRESLDAIWENTQLFFQKRDPRQIELAQKNPKYKLALLFRSYLGRSSRWAISGDETRCMDYQLWCGPAMGSFNHWVKDSYLSQLAYRNVKQIAYNLLEGATVITRAQQLRSMGVILPAQAFHYEPKYFED
jgi:trans-AT polyketide synthase, acyltransferase and oxidoreductase domains